MSKKRKARPKAARPKGKGTAKHDQAVAEAEFQKDSICPELRAAIEFEKRSKALTHDGFSKFKIGDVVILDHKRCVCYRVNDCRACFTPLVTRSVSFETVTGKAVSFIATESNTISVSPNAEIDIIERLGADWKNKPGQPENESMKTEESTGKKTELNPIGAKVLPSGHISLAGRSEYIAELVAKGITKLDKVIELVKVKWPTHASPVHIAKIIKAAQARQPIKKKKR